MWPMFVLTEPTASGRPGSRPRPSTARQGLDLDRVAERRAGAVRLDVVDVARADAGGARARRASPPPAPGPFGTVRPLLRPSWLTAEPRITARIAVAVRERVGEPLEHDHAAALAADEAVGGGVERLAAPVRRQHPPASRTAAMASGERITLTPPASARSHSPARRLWQARWTATSDDEQAVSTADAGPLEAEGEGEAARRGVERVAGGRVDVRSASRSPTPSDLSRSRWS